MSHIASVTINVKSLEALARAAKTLGLELVTDQKSYKWYGKWMNDYHAQEAAVKNGFDPKKFGSCEHAIRVVGNARAYEIGVVKDPKGEGYTLLYDNFCEGFGLEEKAGKGLVALKQEYGVQVARATAARLGMRIEQSRTKDGRVRLVCKR